ncbi:MAG: phosphoglucosamine mutase [Gemmatimonadetes bacterium]|nr:phosphoglucosamine mutase [Gemmatimonadota bacterium]MBK7834963.1 phosphoglucosamine mutase [Gemmatimonadota bacterium]MBK8645021.1 phosphoglucosamine mutase [Gemmatimonadota bacterium]MBK9409080.1 phosphoglucosamine mutase [Gemmatimonadota bacterium]MBK9979299.1 phosphoglucosamine mutase [Gemmatimonadota bacterium]
MSLEGLMVSVSGVRGRVGEALTPEIACQFAAAFGAFSVGRSSSRVIIVGRDSRVSGPMFHRAVVAALQSVGADVLDIGMAPTPTVQMAVEHHHAAGGLAITASHNPVEWNALKFIGSSGLFLDAAEGAEMRACMERGIPRATWDKLGSVSNDEAAIDRHIEAILALPFLDVEGIRRRAYHVALDTCHGAGITMFPKLLERLGCRVSAINLEPHGRFHRPPEPVAENLGELEALVKSSGAVVGFATDPDVDRLALVSDAGVAIGEDYTLALAARVILRQKRGTVVTNLSTSRIVADVAAEAGCEVVLAPVGEVNVAVKMRSVGAVVGGEGNGGVILPDLHLGRDAPLAAALILQLLHESNGTLSAVVASYPQYRIVKDKLDRPNVPLDEVYGSLRRSFADAVVDLQDGLRLTWPDRWVHVRPSGTEPIVRVIAEAPTEEGARELVRRCRAPLDALSA